MSRSRLREDHGESALDESGRSAVEWMVALTSGGLTEKQRHDFDLWRSASPANAEAWARMSGGLLPFETLARSGMPRGSLSQLHPVSHGSRRAVLATMLGLGFVGGGATVVQRFVPLEGLLSDYSTRTAEHEGLRLADASEIVLAPRSSINVAMTPEARSIEFVSGRMMVEIAPNDTRPFVVEMGPSRLTAEAGAFVLDRRDGQVSVTGLKGHGTFRSAAGRRLAVAESERLVVSGSDLSRSRIDVDAARSWTSGMAIFRNESVGGIVDQLRPYYAGFIRVAPEAAERRATGVVNLFDPVASLDMVARSVGLTVVRTAGAWIKIEPRYT